MIRRVLHTRKVGHAGTLDPFATGLLIVGVGREATKRFQEIVGLDKEYDAVFVLGEMRDTDDRTGRTIDTPLNPPLKRGEIEALMQTFLGEIEQIPPAYAAIKIKGKKMYELARQGKTVEAAPRKVRIDKFELLSEPIRTPSGSPLERGRIKIKVRIHCSSGTYIRAIARDMGGYVEELRRTAVGPITIAQACTLAEVAISPQNHLLSIDDFFARMAA